MASDGPQRTQSDVSKSDDSSTLPVNPLNGETAASSKQKKGLQFWLIILSICVSVFLSALEYVSAASFSFPLKHAEADLDEGSCIDGSADYHS